MTAKPSKPISLSTPPAAIGKPLWLMDAFSIARGEYIGFVEGASVYTRDGEVDRRSLQRWAHFCASAPPKGRPAAPEPAAQAERPTCQFARPCALCRHKMAT